MYFQINSIVEDIPENLRPEETTLSPLNDLLIHRLWRVVHNDRTVLVVDFGIYSRISDEVDYPLLAFILVEP